MKNHLRPKECCGFGDYSCQIPMPLNGKVVGIDYCISDVIAALNAAGIKTVASCCGHSKVDGDIVLEDGRVIKVYNHVRYWERNNERR